MLKINTDAGWLPGSPWCSTGIVIRDSMGCLVAGSASRALAHSPLVAEPLALREGIVLAQNLDYD